MIHQPWSYVGESMKQSDLEVASRHMTRIRTSTERQEAFIHGSIFQGGVDYETIMSAIEKARAIHRGEMKLAIVPDYDVDDVSATVVRVIEENIDVINKQTWLKS